MVYEAMTARHTTSIETQQSDNTPVIQNAPRLSIILCTYNRRNLVLSALASLRRQTLDYAQFEVIVIDNGSTDGTLEAVRTYISAGVQPERKPEDIWQVQCLSEQQNGLAYARHTGLLAASGEIAVFLDDDVLADPHYLAHLLAAYDETNADAIGGRVELRWEAARPHWLTDDLLDMLGYYAPSPKRIQLVAGKSFSSCNFSVKIEALRDIGFFSPFLSKRLHVPASMEVDDLCQRLHSANYALWYDPDVAVAHRAPAARLNRAYFVGRAYWQGRSEVLTRYANRSDIGLGDERLHSRKNLVKTLLPELREICYLALLHRPLLYLAGRSSAERLEAQMAQARSWGHLRQRLQFLEHAPPEVMTPAVLLVRSSAADYADPTIDLLADALTRQDVACTQSKVDIPISWLWRHRTYQGQAMGIVHLYRPGAFQLSRRKRRQLWFRLWLARCWGIRIVTTDGGGWWQSTRNLRFLARRTLERNLLYSSDIVLAYTRLPEQLYPDKKLRRRVRCLPHPGLRGSYTPPMSRTEAHAQLGLSPKAGYVLLCFAHNHTERELIQLIEAFSEAKKQAKAAETPAPASIRAQLLLVGSPADKKVSSRILKLAALNSAVHLSLVTPGKDDIPLYLGAADAVVLPHFANQKAGVLTIALLALSYGKCVVAPNLPRFQGMLPPSACSYYDPASRSSLVQALLKVQTLHLTISEKESRALEAESGWGQYAHRLLKIYKMLLNRHPPGG